MAVQHQILDWSLPAATALTSNQFYAVQLRSDGRVNTISTTTTAAFGILQDDPEAADEACRIRVAGVSKMVVDGSAAPIYPGYTLGVDTSSRGVFTTTDNRNIIAVALETSTAANDIISVFVLPSVRY